jgi:hypothetical protein
VSLHEFYDKKSKTYHQTEVVLIICNYHYVRENANNNKCLPIKPQDCSVSVKVSSTIFKSKSEKDDANESKKEYHFDGSGAQMPYSTFLSLIDSESFKDFLESVKGDFEKTEGAIFDESSDENESQTTQSDGAEPAASEND